MEKDIQEKLNFLFFVIDIIEVKFSVSEKEIQEFVRSNINSSKEKMAIKFCRIYRQRNHILRAC